MTGGFRRGARVLLAAALGLVFVSAAGCKLDEGAFHAKVFQCNPSAADPGCGTDEDDKPMACVAAHQLGGRDFCASSCNRSAPDQSGGTAVCMASGSELEPELSGASLKKCDPMAAGDVCGNAELSCMRTDLRENEGVCMTVNPCNSSADCRDPTRSTCMGELLLQTYGEKAELRTDRSYCLQTGCNARGAQCSPGESCVRKLLSRAAKAPDICVPNCDANQNCPPNYFCIPGLYSKASPSICIPGLPGFRCRSKLDCLVGDCVDSGAGFNICSTKCGSDADCAKFDSEQETFVCNREKGHCVGPRVMVSGLCYADTDCRNGEICGFTSPAARDGNCMKPCSLPFNPKAPLGACPSHGGIPHVCVPDLKSAQGQAAWTRGYCAPSMFAGPCAVDAQCVGGMTCKANKCTVACDPARDPADPDADCKANRFTRDGYCDATKMACVPPRKDGDVCAANSECESRSCVPRVGAPGVSECAKTPGW